MTARDPGARLPSPQGGGGVRVALFSWHRRWTNDCPTPPQPLPEPPLPMPPWPKPAQRESWRSEELLGDRTEVLIVHNNEVYRLRRTRQGKLILYKIVSTCQGAGCIVSAERRILAFALAPQVSV